MIAVGGILTSVEFWKFAIPLLGAVIAWFTNEWRKRIVDQYQRKEANYKDLVRSLRGFYVGSENAEGRKPEFLSQLNISWLYCPDEVIKGTNFWLCMRRGFIPTKRKSTRWAPSSQQSAPTFSLESSCERQP
jgi:hypothetical protein